MAGKINPIERIRNNMDELTSEFYISSIGVFGSYARDEATEVSDVDILVEFSERVGMFHFIDLQERLKEILGCNVDLVTRNGLHPLLKDQILKEVKYI